MTKTTKSNWVTNPTKKQMILTNLVWLTGITLMILSMTDLFKENPFKSKNIMLFFLIIIATITEIKVTYNYFKNQTSNK
jgi:hypothetical protein